VNIVKEFLQKLFESEKENPKGPKLAPLVGVRNDEKGLNLEPLPITSRFDSFIYGNDKAVTVRQISSDGNEGVKILTSPLKVDMLAYTQTHFACRFPQSVVTVFSPASSTNNINIIDLAFQIYNYSGTGLNLLQISVKGNVVRQWYFDGSSPVLRTFPIPLSFPLNDFTVTISYQVGTTFSYVFGLSYYLT
jgi:hypothetical protein